MGWRQNHLEQIEAELKGSALVVAAYENSVAIGAVRLMWDGGGTAVIPSILVAPEHQNRGVEQELLTRVFSFLTEKLKPGFGIQLDIRVWGNQKPVYENLGFQVSASEQRGIPMHICLTNQIELTDAMYKQMDFADK